ncbi:MAG: dipeptidase E [Clostridiales bacterium]|nr:dipeptidase E [Clostridiales bacterium]
MILFLTSYLDSYYKDKNGNKIAQNFGNENGILDNFKKYIKKYDNFVFVASQMADTTKTDGYADIMFKSFEMTLPFKNYQVLDHRNKDKAQELIENADFIFLCGGHLPSQLELFEHLNLRELIKNTNAIICGGSAGSMDSAEIVYCPPEIEGEALDTIFKRYRKGLGLTNINIYPHWNESLIEEEYLDGKNIFRDIMLEDSKNSPFIAFDDGTYILQADNEVELFGKAYMFKNGKYIKVSNCNLRDFQNTREL